MCERERGREREKHLLFLEIEEDELRLGAISACASESDSLRTFGFATLGVLHQRSISSEQLHFSCI